MSHPLAGKRVLVIGASGFVGSRLVERLSVECGATVRVLVRRVMAAAVIARFPIELVVGDITNASDVAAAMEGCAVVFNCVKGKGADAGLRRATDVDGARTVVEAAASAGARVVHMSTMAVYDRPSDGEFDETAADAPPGDPYTDTKRAGERAVLSTASKLRVPVTVIQPSVIYGPNAGVYGADILQEMQSHRLILVNGGSGICNALYIDDAVTALLQAAVRDEAIGQRLLVTGPAWPTWAEFFGYFERLVGSDRTISLSASEAIRMWNESQRRPGLLRESIGVLRENAALRRRLLGTREGAVVRSVARRALPLRVRERLRTPAVVHATTTSDALPVAIVRPWVVQNMARRARVRADKARALLGYAPVVSLDEGMRLTAAWARWARLAPDKSVAGV